MITCQNITKRYSLGAESVLKGVDLQLQPGEIVALLGPSGAGKSTLLRILGLIEDPCAGALSFDGQVITGKEQHVQQIAKQRVSFVFQDHALLESHAVIDNILLPIRCRGKVTQEHRARVASIAADLGIQSLLQRKLGSLSGGQQQRVALARGLVTQPSLLLCDEPTSALDRDNVLQVAALLKTIRDHYGLTIVTVTHDNFFAGVVADKSYRLASGVLSPVPAGGVS